MIVDAIDTGFPEGDCAYNAVHAASDGRVYFAIGTHRIDSHARLGCFDPRTRSVSFVAGFDDVASGGGQHAVPHGKVHVALAEHDGRLYFATMPGYYGTDLQGRRPYPGGRVLDLNLNTGRLTDLGGGPAGEGFIAAVFDGERQMYIALTWPGGYLCRFDVRSGTHEIWPRPDGTTARAPICRSLGLDPDGAVYGSSADGSIWRALPGRPPEPVRGVTVSDGAVPPIDRKARAQAGWRVIRWHTGDACFYGIHAGTQSLFRFEPRRGRIEPIARLGAATLHGRGHAPFRSQLGLAIDHRGRALHLSHGPAAPRRGRPRVPRGVYLTRCDPVRRAVVERGPIETRTGERVLFAESLAADAGGRLFSMAWVEVSDPDQRRHFVRLRTQAAPSETRGEPYRMSLVESPEDAHGVET